MTRGQTAAIPEIKLGGRLTMLDTAGQLQRVLDAARQSPQLQLDLTGVEAVDSLALSLLLEAQRRLQAQGGQLRVHGIPDPLLSLARLYGAESLLQEMSA